MVTLDMHRIDRPRPPPYAEKVRTHPPPHIYLGGVKATTKADVLIKPPHAITHLLSLGCTPLAPDIHTHFPPPSHALCLEHVEDYMDQDLLQLLPTILSFLHNQHPPTTPPSYLIHCVQGMSRSVTAVLAYFMICEGFPLLEVYQLIVNARPLIALNPGFLRQMFFLEDYLLHRQLHTHAHTHAHLQMNLLRAVEAEYRIYLLDEIIGGREYKAGTEKALLEKVETSFQAFRDLCERHHHHHHRDTHTDTNQNREDEKGDYYHCRHCHHRLFTTQDLVRHGQEATQAALARVAAVTAITWGAAEWYGYEEEFLRQPLLHVKPLPMSYYGGKPPKKKKQKKGGGGGKGKGKGGGGKKEEVVVVEEEEEANEGRKECPWWYVQPVEWVLPLLFPSSLSSGSRRVSIACPGRHCGAAVGMLERRMCKKQEDKHEDEEEDDGNREKGKEKEEEEADGEDVVCECGTAVPLVMVRFKKEQCVYVPSTLAKEDEEEEDEEEEEEGVEESV